MDQSSQLRSVNNPAIFSRNTLELTFRLLRNENPTLALKVQNVLALQKIPGSTNKSTIRAADQFYVNLKADTLGKVVAALTKIGQKMLNDHSEEYSSEKEQRVVLRALIQKWMNLAEWTIVRSVNETPATR